MLIWLLFNALAGAALMLLAWALQRFQRITPRLLHTLWLLVLLRVIAPPVPLRESLAPTSSTPSPPPAALIESGTPAYQREMVAWMTERFGDNWSNDLPDMLLALWALGAFSVLARELARDRRLRTALSGGTPADGSLLARLHGVAQRIGWKGPLPQTSVLAGVDSPFLWSPLLSLRRRVICVLPTNVARLPDSVLAHELMHMRRKDHWAAWAEFAALVIGWWNPLVHYARRQLQVSAELACDGDVLHHFPEERRAYATALVDTLERECAAEWRTTALGTSRAVGWDAAELAQRLERILKHEVRPRPLAPLRIAALVGVLLSLPGMALPGLAQLAERLPTIPNELSESRAATLLAESEERLALDPTDGAATATLGRVLIALGRFLEAAEVLERQVELGFQPANASYNQACALALAGEPDSAMRSLERAIRLGIPREFPLHDKDLQTLRNLPRFQRLVAFE